MSKKKNVVLMAWGGAKETAQQVTEFNKYTGILPVSIIALNPNKAELSKILGRDIEDDPSYIFDAKDGKPKTLRIELIVKPAGVEFEGIQFMNRINYFIRMEIMRNKDIGQAQIALQLFEKVQDLRLNRHIQRRNRLVADDQLRL